MKLKNKINKLFINHLDFGSLGKSPVLSVITPLTLSLIQDWLSIRNKTVSLPWKRLVALAALTPRESPPYSCFVSRSSQGCVCHCRSSHLPSPVCLDTALRMDPLASLATTFYPPPAERPLVNCLFSSLPVIMLPRLRDRLKAHEPFE